MAKSQADKLFERLRANGLRKRVARDLSQALASASGSRPSKSATARLSDLRKVVTDLEDRARGGPAKRRAAAKKAAQTRKRKAARRSTASKKAARTRAKSRA
jgi:hypothetical protein